MKVDTDAFWGWLVIAVGIFGVIGWIANIVKLADDCCGMSGMLLVRAIGILFMPLGAVLGYV